MSDTTDRAHQAVEAETITPNQALACMLAWNKHGAQLRIISGEPFVFVVAGGRLTVELVDESSLECGYDGCPNLGREQFAGRCWGHGMARARKGL